MTVQNHPRCFDDALCSHVNAAPWRPSFHLSWGGWGLRFVRFRVYGVAIMEKGNLSRSIVYQQRMYVQTIHIWCIIVFIEKAHFLAMSIYAVICSMFVPFLF